MGLRRRSFLRQLCLGVAGIGLAELGLERWGDRYIQALAEPGQRKLALLVGINQYPGANLGGCVTDVELQRELLLHRFGFQSADILTLTDQQATRQNLESAFLNHLTEQARSGDVVVFHFSGYGGLVSTGGIPEAAQTSLVPVDSLITGETGTPVNDLLGETLRLLLSSLQTNQITTVLDTSYVYTGETLQGNWRVRSRPTLLLDSPNEAELAFQQQLRSRMEAGGASVRSLNPTNQFPGLVLAAAGMPSLPLEGGSAPGEERAFEVQWNGFSAGLLTYALTQSLWQALPANTVRVWFNRVSGTIGQLAGWTQHPALEGQRSQESALVPYYLAPQPTQGAEGAVIGVEDAGKTARIWLGGMPAALVERYEVNSLLRLLSDNPPGSTQEPLPGAWLQVTARDGLLVKAKVCCLTSAEESNSPPVRVGQWVREVVRVVPRNISLTVGLDSSLERIERVDATSAFSAIPRVSSVLVGESADYLFGKIQATESPPTQVAALPNAVPAIVNNQPTSYGLFSPKREVISNTVGDRGEAVKVAVQRLAPALQTLLAAKLLSLTVNGQSSQLKIRTNLELVTPKEEVVMQQATGRSLSLPGAKSPSMAIGMGKKGIATLPTGTRIQYRIRNEGDRPLYFLLLGFENNRKVLNLYMNPVSAPIEGTTPSLPWQGTVTPGTRMVVPNPSDTTLWAAPNNPGLVETYLVCCTAPFNQTSTVLESMLRSTGVRPVTSLSTPLEVVQAIVQDLHQASSSVVPATIPDGFTLDVNQWATLPFIYLTV